MFPVNIFYYKKNKTKYFNKGMDNIFEVPPGVDDYQHEIKIDNKYDYVINSLLSAAKEELSTNKIEGKTFCFYCGTKTSKIVPGFLHDGSGLNLWIYTDWRCSSIICDTCCKYAGKLNVNYKLKVDEVPSNVQSIPRKLLKFEPDILLPGLEATHKHFSFSREGKLVPLTERALQTIDRFSLNRLDLVNRRLKVISEYTTNIHGDSLNKLSLLELSPIDCLFLKELGESNEEDTIEYYSKYLYRQSPLYVEPELIFQIDTLFPYKRTSFKKLNRIQRAKGKIYTSSPNIEKFEFSGIRGFSNQLSVSFEGKESLLILGENGVGKSTLLELFRQAFMPQTKVSINDLVDHPNSNPYFKVEYSEQDSYFKYMGDGRKEGKRLASNVIVISESRISKIKINSFVTWLQETSEDEDLINWISRKLKILLNLPQTYEFIVNKENVYWISNETSNKRFYLDHFSSGYRSLMVVFHAILSKLTYKNKTDNLPILEQGLAHSIVLIDEIELHLHPTFKKQVVKTLKTVFPGVLFIMTTHDPLIIKSADENVSIIVLNKVNERTHIQSNLPDHTNLTTEQILTSQIFGLSTTESNIVKQNRVNEYYKAINNKEWESVDKLREQLTDVGFFGTTYRELISLSAIDAYLAKRDVPKVNKIVEILDNMDNDNA